MVEEILSTIEDKTFLNMENTEIRIVPNMSIKEENGKVSIYSNDTNVGIFNFIDVVNDKLAIVFIKKNYYAVYCDISVFN